MVITDFSMSKFEDVSVVVSMQPPVPIGGWSLRFQAGKNFGFSSGLINKYWSSGFAAGASGITITNSGQGVFRIDIYTPDTSGLQYGNLAYQVFRTDSGSMTEISQGYLSINP